MLRLIIAALLLPASAAAQEVRVAIGDVGGRGGGKRAIGKLQKQIRRLLTANFAGSRSCIRSLPFACCTVVQ